MHCLALIRNPAPDPGLESLKKRAFIAATLGILFSAMDASIYFMILHPALSDILKTTSDSEIGYYGSLILCIFMIGWGVGSLVFGVIADRIGRARTMVMTILLYLYTPDFALRQPTGSN